MLELAGGDLHGLGLNLTHGMLDVLGREIVGGRYETHPFPPEAKISEAHGVSRSVTREAVKMLAAKGLVSARARLGTVVEPTSRWNLFDADVLRWSLECGRPPGLLGQFGQLRIAIEPQAAALAALHRSRDELKAIRAGLAHARAADVGHIDPLNAEVSFHLAVLRASHNPFYASLQTVVAIVLRTSVIHMHRAGRQFFNIDGLAAVTTAIAACKPEVAQVAMRNVIGKACIADD